MKLLKEERDHQRTCELQIADVARVAIACAVLVRIDGLCEAVAATSALCM